MKEVCPVFFFQASTESITVILESKTETSHFAFIRTFRVYISNSFKRNTSFSTARSCKKLHLRNDESQGVAHGPRDEDAL